MPCRYDPSPQEIAAEKQAAKAKKTKEDNDRKAVLDDMTQEICRLRTIVMQLVNETIAPAEFKLTKEYDNLIDKHLIHRDLDRARMIETLALKLQSARTNKEKETLLVTLRQVTDLTNEELFTTNLF